MYLEVNSSKYWHDYGGVLFSALCFSSFFPIFILCVCVCEAFIITEIFLKSVRAIISSIILCL